ncbi:MAG: ATP-binding domain-containing protein, partial [Deltaproteobacteria bacterium]|nr:ATP-binding domain-containing protein [Deltaproteobacteria bacterium]
KNIFLVGDEDQSIYSFRGARYQNIQDFCSDFNVSQIFKLEQNYRSSQEILQVANSIIINNKSRHEKNLFSEISTGVKPVYRSFYSDVDEASFIASNVQSLVSQGLETAIFYRTNALARALEEKFVEQKIPYRIVGGVRFMERKEIKDCVAWLRFQRNNNDSVAFSRIIGNLNMGIGRVTLDKILLESQNSDCLTALSKFRSDVAELLKRIWQVGGNKPYTLLKTAIEETKYIDYLVEKLGKERLDTLLEFLGFAKRFEDEGKNIDEFLDHISLVAEPLRENEQEDQTIKKPVLMTLHLSKGLEFDAVFICGFEDGLIPHALCRREHEIEEERRLLYVGVTRARKLLFLTSAYSRASYFGFGREVSRFFWEIPAQFIDVDSAPVSPASLSIEESSATNRNELLEGNRVNHYLYGAGRVIKILDSGRALVEFDAPKDLKFVNLSELLLTE